MKKRLLSLVLCLVMVFSLFPALDMVARAEVVNDVYESIDGVTWTADPALYAQYASQSEGGQLWAKIGDEFYPVDYTSTQGSLWHPDTRTDWTATSAYTAGARTNANDSNLYYAKNANSKVVVSKTTKYQSVTNEIDMGASYMNHSYFENHHYSTDFYVYVPHSGTDVDGSHSCWHRVYYREDGYTGDGYYYTFYYYTNSVEGSGASFSNGSAGDVKGSGSSQVRLLCNYHACATWGSRIGVFFEKDGYIKYWHNSNGNAGTDGNLYKTNGSSNEYNYMTAGDTILACQAPASVYSHNYSGTLYTRVNNKVTALKANDQVISNPITEDNEVLYTGTLYIKLPNEVTDPNPTVAPTANPEGILNPGGVDDAGFKLQKELSQNTEGTYDITMQSYSTANTVTESLVEKVPTDFVVIVDQSGSMKTADMATGYQATTTKTLEDCAKGSYYYKDGDTYYRVYATRDYLMEYHASETLWTKNIIEDAGMSLSWFQGEDEATFSQANQYYYKTSDGIYRPVHVTATGKVGTYYIKFYYENAQGTRVDFVRPSKPVYKNVFGSDTSKYGPGSFGYGAVNAAVLAAYPTTTAYTYSTFLGITTGMYVNYPMYSRHVGYTQLCYRDVNGVEHIVPSNAGLATAEYCNSAGQAITSATGSTRMNYSGLYEATGYERRIDALKGALTEFVKAVAAESDTKEGANSTCAVDNRIAIVGFSSDDDKTHGWGYDYYNNTEILTTGLSGTDGVQMRNADSDDYAAALVSATDGQIGANHVNSALTNAINAITYGGGTQPEYGFQMAQNIFAQHSSEQYEFVTGERQGTKTERNKIVIFFTDGQPGDYDDSDQYSEANDVIRDALPLKSAGVKVFSIGVFGESDGNPLTYDASNDWAYNENGQKVRVSRLRESSWKYLGGYVGVSEDGNCLRRQWRPNNAAGYTPTANDTIFDYMSVVSSNYPQAQKFIDADWLDPDTDFPGNYIAATEGVRHSDTAADTNQFYRMAANQATLVSAFKQSVSYASVQQQNTGAVNLNATSIFKDAINTADFDVSNATYSVTWQPIKVDKTAVESTGSAIVNDDSRPLVTPVVNQKVPANGVIEYTGFDYGANYVSWGKTQGYKLIVTVHGIVPTTYNQVIKSNADPVGKDYYACGIYEYGKDTPAHSVQSPTLYVELHEPATTDVVMNKDISDADPEDGSYTITLDAYAKGNSNQGETTTETTGTDVVIVVDKSNSMGLDMGNTTRYNKAVEAINAFIGEADDSEADHRIAIVRGGDASGASQVVAYNGGTVVSYADIQSNADNIFKSVKTESGDINSALTAMNDSSMNLGVTFDAVNKLLTGRADQSRKAIVIFLSDGKPNGYIASDAATQFGFVKTLKADAEVFAVQIDTSTTNNSEGFMKSVSSSYPNGDRVGNSWVPGDKSSSDIEYYQYINPSTTTDFTGVFNEVMEIIDLNVNLDKDAYLIDVINMANLAVRSDLSQPIVHVYTRKGTADQNGNVTLEDMANRVEITDKVDISFPTVTDEQGNENLAVKVTGFDYSANYIGYPKPVNVKEGTGRNEGKQIIIEISGLVPVHPGDEQTSNIHAGVYDKDDDLAKEVPSPTFDIGSNTSKTYVIDFGAPMIVATDAKSVSKMGGSNGSFSLVEGNVIYQLNGSVSGTQSTFAFSGVDQAFALAKPVGLDLTTRAWSVLTAIPAGSVYFDDDFTATTTIVDGEPVTTFKQPINVGDGSGWNEDVDVSPATANTAAGEYTFTFYGTGIDIYCSTTTDGGYVQAKCEGQVQTVKNYDKTVERYNVPSISFTGLELGEQHTVTLNVLGSSNYKLDGIRIYNPISDQTQYAGEAASEKYATYINMREALVNNTVNTSFSDSMTDTVLGALFVDDRSKLSQLVTATEAEINDSTIVKFFKDSDNNPVEIKDGVTVPDGAVLYKRAYASEFEAYQKNSPKHEIYLDHGEAIIFEPSVNAVNAANAGQLWIGLSAPDAATDFTKAKVEINGVEKAITSGVDMYYPIAMNGRTTITIENTGTAMISVTNLKIAGNKDIYDAAIAPDAGTASAGEDASVLSVSDVIPMVFEPVTSQTVKIAANNGVDPDAPAPVEPTPTPTPTPDDPTPTPSLADLVRQMISNFVSSLFQSIARLFHP